MSVVTQYVTFDRPPPTQLRQHTSRHTPSKKQLQPERRSQTLTTCGRSAHSE